ncbi:MAG: transporter substrate-binding domain-containing protein [Trueperaceae bacterium]|nr:transporter substrate-binding domain-containing protein [Trueperaceae bacterium]
MRIKGPIGKCLVLSALMALCSVWTLAQTSVPYVPPDSLNERRFISQTELRFCVWSENPLKDFEVQVATEIAHALLLEPRISILTRPPTTSDSDFWETMYLSLTNECEALMGYILVPEHLPEWMIASRPYYSEATVLAVTDASLSSLADVPRGTFVGTLLSTFSDFQFMNYNQTLPTGQSWRRLPYDSPQKLIARLLDGTLSAAIVPEAVLYGVLNESGGLTPVVPKALSPLNVVPTLYSIGMRSSETSLRVIVDEAILALIQDGTIQSVLDRMGLPGRSGPAGR